MILFTEEEKSLIQTFRGQVKDVLDNDYEESDLYLIRWLRARDEHLEKAELMLRSAVQWRKEVKVLDLLATTPEAYFAKNFQYWLNGVDLLGRPVLCVPMGCWDVRKCVDDGKIDGFNEYIIRIFERVTAAIRDCNSRQKDSSKPITEFLLIVNWDNFSIRQTSNLKAVQSLLAAVSVFEAYYPEILGQALFINTNAVFQAFFALMKPILAARTLGKITCYGSNRKEWEPIVRATVEEHQIARQFGG